jgi:hypothetical protein
MISDNVLIAYEITHYLLNKSEGDCGYAALKLDMSKAYDRVEWSFLHKMMERMGFGVQWINLIMKCVQQYHTKLKLMGF